jgi:hypothetical protein
MAEGGRERAGRRFRPSTRWVGFEAEARGSMGEVPYIDRGAPYFSLELKHF